MMKRLSVSAVLSMVVILGAAIESQANGGLFRRSGGCNSGCDTPCAAPCMPVAPAPVQYEERKVTAYKYVTVEKEIDTIVCKRVVTDEKFTYTVCVPVTKDEVRKETFYVRQDKQVEFKYTVLVPRTVQKVVKQTTYQCIRENVTEMVPVCRLVRVSCVDECGRCYTRCERVTCMEPRTRCITKTIPTTQDVTINEIVCDRVEKTGTRTVCEMIPQTRDVTVKICSFVNEKREGTRQVCSYVNEKVKQKVQVCERVAYETTVRVAICNTSCDTGCDNGCGSGHGRRFGGLFRRGGCCN